MPIELKITGNHATDIVAEVQLLAQVFGIGTEQPSKNVAGETKQQPVSTTSAPSQPAATSTAAPATGGKTEAPKTLDRKGQDEAVKEMIAAGAKDARFDQLTKGRQQEVEEALTKPAEAAPAKSDDVDDMFDDAPAAATTTVTRDMISELMGQVCKKPDGTAIQNRALKVREILVDRIPEGMDVKVKNITEDKLAEAYDLIKKVGETVPAE